MLPKPASVRRQGRYGAIGVTAGVRGNWPGRPLWPPLPGGCGRGLGPYARAPNVGKKCLEGGKTHSGNLSYGQRTMSYGQGHRCLVAAARGTEREGPVPCLKDELRNRPNTYQAQLTRSHATHDHNTSRRANDNRGGLYTWARDPREHAATRLLSLCPTPHAPQSPSSSESLPRPPSASARGRLAPRWPRRLGRRAGFSRWRWRQWWVRPMPRQRVASGHIGTKAKAPVVHVAQHQMVFESQMMQRCCLPPW